MLNDSHYQRENGMPVVTIFGLYVSSGNSYSTAQQTDLINYFQSRGVYVVGAAATRESAGQTGECRPPRRLYPLARLLGRVEIPTAPTEP